MIFRNLHALGNLPKILFDHVQWEFTGFKRIWQKPARYLNFFIPIIFGFILAACQPTVSESIVVTEVVKLGDIEVIITRVIEVVDTPTPTPPPPPVQIRPIELDLAYLGVLQNLDPQQASQKSSLDLIENLFAGLTNFNPETEQVEPELATHWDINGDGRTWTFHLRDDIFWINPGDPPIDPGAKWQIETIRSVTANDILFALQRACQLETNTPDAFLLFIISGCEEIYRSLEPDEATIQQLGVRVIDEQTLEIKLNEPASYFLTITTLPFFRPVPPELVEEYGNTWKNQVGDFANGWQTPENIITSGPFFPSPDIFNDEEVILHRNPAWPIQNEGNVDNVNILFLDEDMAMFDLWEAKLLDVSLLPVDTREAFLKKTPNKAWLIPNQTIFYLGFNFESGIFREPEVRRAFSAAIEREPLVEDMFESRAQPMKHISPPGMFGAPPVNEVGLGFRPDYARQQMDRSSFRNCKLLPPLTFLVSTADLSLLQAELLRDMWVQELDCVENQINIEQVDFGELLAITNPDSTNRPDVWELAWPSYYPDVHNVLYDVFHCTDGENRLNRPCSVEDDLLRQASVTPNIDERRSYYREVENLFFGEDGSYPIIPLYVRGDYRIVQNWLTFVPTLSGGEQFDAYIIDEELKRLERSRG